MFRGYRRDPYDGFKNDLERRRALNTKVRSQMAAVMVAAIAGTPINWTEMLRWLTRLLH